MSDPARRGRAEAKLAEALGARLQSRASHVLRAQVLVGLEQVARVAER